MTNKLIYISGPISGLLNNNFQEFARAQEKIESLGYQVINPHVICSDIDPKQFADDREYWQACMKICLTHLMRADKVVTLDRWEYSQGAKIEVNLARSIFIDVQHIVSFMASTKC